MNGELRMASFMHNYLRRKTNHLGSTIQFEVFRYLDGCKQAHKGLDYVTATKLDLMFLVAMIV